MAVSPVHAPRHRRIRPTRSRRGHAIAAALTTTVLAGAAGSAAADTDTTVVTKPTVVLVHGAFADASSWNAVVERLQHDGFSVVAPANPLRGLAGDSAYIADFLKSIQGPIVLVGHSYGGAVISTAAAGNAQVKSLVFVNAFMPDKGEALGALGDRFPGSELAAALKPVPFRNADGTSGTDLYLRAAKFHQAFAADLPAAVAAVMAATQRPIVASAFMDKAAEAAWKTIPSWALVSTRDKAIPPALERFEAQRAHAQTVEVDASHVALVSHPDAVTDLIRQAATDGGSYAQPALAGTGLNTLVLAGLGVLAGGTVLMGFGLSGAARKRREPGREPGRDPGR
ncbi:alpha/beta fold hydrolase [Streptomyces sp. NPDC058217]|uniref:alpha/beta fold hydrolase n=1 Tax=Streptomyces sp. NPDC058217 TaxID=3346384 RepID=UPI0036E3D7E4